MLRSLVYFRQACEVGQVWILWTRYEIFQYLMQFDTVVIVWVYLFDSITKCNSMAVSWNSCIQRRYSILIHNTFKNRLLFHFKNHPKSIHNTFKSRLLFHFKNPWNRITVFWPPCITSLACVHAEQISLRVGVRRHQRNVSVGGVCTWIIWLLIVIRVRISHSKVHCHCFKQTCELAHCCYMADNYSHSNCCSCTALECSHNSSSDIDTHIVESAQLNTNQPTSI